MFHDFLFANRNAIVARTRAKVAARTAPYATHEELEELESGIPLFLDQLISMLRKPNGDDDAIMAGASRHGLDLLKRGFTVGQVVYDYGGLCQAVTELADEKHSPITADEFHTFNKCLDSASPKPSRSTRMPESRSSCTPALNAWEALPTNSATPRRSDSLVPNAPKRNRGCRRKHCSTSRPEPEETVDADRFVGGPGSSRVGIARDGARRRGAVHRRD